MKKIESIIIAVYNMMMSYIEAAVRGDYSTPIIAVAHGTRTCWGGPGGVMCEI